jgi:hypothetical protein
MHQVRIRAAQVHFRVCLASNVRQQQALSLMDALAKMTIMPARRLESIAPQMK